MLFLAESLIRHTNHNRTSYLSLSFSQLYPLLLLVWATSLPVVKAQQGLMQNVTVSSADPSIQYTPTNEWFPAVVTNGVDGSTLSFMQSVVFNASIAFTITEPSTALYWRGFLPTTPARYSVCIDCPNPATDLGDVVTLGQADLGSNGSNNTAVILYANERLQNTTHTIVIRNIRNDIEGVVGRMSLDAFLYSTSVLVPSSSGSSQTRGLIIGIVLASVVALALLGALGITCAIRYRRRTAYLKSSYNNNAGYRGNFSSSGGYGGGSSGNSGYRTNEKSGRSPFNPFASSKRSKSFNSRALNAYKAGVIGALKPRGTASGERDEQASSSFSKAYDTWNSSLRGNSAMDPSSQVPPLPPSLAPPMLDRKPPSGQQQERPGWKNFLPGFGRRGDGMNTTLRTMQGGDISRDDLPSAATTRIGDAATPTAMFSEKPSMDNLKKGKGVFGAILPVYHARTRSAEEDIKSKGLGYDEKELPVAPEIIVTSPTTIPTSPSAYSSNGTTKSGSRRGSHRKSSSLFTPSTKNANALRPSDPSGRYSKSNTRSVRMSDPYVNYAAAYAAYAGFEDEIDIHGATSIEGYGPVDGLGYGSMGDGDFGSMGNSRSALRESVVLPQGTLLIPAPPTTVAPAPPYTSSNSTTTVQVTNRGGRTGAPPPSAFNPKVLPVETKKDGNRDGAKKKRTLSDKIKRGTLPTIPDFDLDEKTKEKRSSRASSRRDSIELRKSSLERTSLDEERRHSRQVLRKPSREAIMRQPSNDTFGRTSNELARKASTEFERQEAKKKAQNRPSLMPNFSSGSSSNLTNASASPPKEPSPTQEVAPEPAVQNPGVIIQVEPTTPEEKVISRKSSRQSIRESRPPPPSSNTTRPSTAESYLSTKARPGSSKSRSGSSAVNELDPNAAPVPYFDAFGSMITVHGSIADRSTSPYPNTEPFHSTGDLSTMAHSTFDLSAFPLPQITMQEPPEIEQPQEASTSSSRVNSRRQTNISLTPSHGSLTMTPSVSEFPMPPLVGSHTRASIATSLPTPPSSADLNHRLSSSSTSLPYHNSRQSMTKSSDSQSVAESSSRTETSESKVPPSSFSNRGRPKRSYRPPRASRVASIQYAKSPRSLGGPTSSKVIFSRFSDARSAKRRSTFINPPSMNIMEDTEDPDLLEKGNTEATQGFSQDRRVHRKSMASMTTNESGFYGGESRVPFILSPPNLERLATSQSMNDGEKSRNPSRLTMASTTTSTDEDFSTSTVQYVVAKRQIPLDVPKAIRSNSKADMSKESLIPPNPSPAGSGSSHGQWEMVGPPENEPQASTSRPGREAPMANIPVSARTERFEGGSLMHESILHGETELTIPEDQNIALGSGMGLPWSPNFDWPASPSAALHSPAPPITSASDTFLLGRDPRDQVDIRTGTSYGFGRAASQDDLSESVVPRRYDYPVSVRTSVWGSSASVSNSRSPISQEVSSSDDLKWRDLMGANSKRLSKRNHRESRVSIASTSSNFFGGGEAPSPIDIPPMPTPTTPMTGNRRLEAIDTTQAWRARTLSSMSPTSSRPGSIRQAGRKSIGNVNTVFATSGSSIARQQIPNVPKISISTAGVTRSSLLSPSSSNGQSSPVVHSPAKPSNVTNRI